MQLNTILAIGTIAFTIFVFSPTEIYYSNPLEFQFLAADFLPLALLSAFAATLIGSATVLSLFRLTSTSIHSRLVAVLVSIQTGLWVEGTFIARNLGPLNGSTVGSQHNGLDAWDLLCWLLVFAIPQATERLRSSTVLRAICVVVLLPQASAFVFQTATATEFSALKRYRADVSGRFEFSKERNVILVVLDEFQSDVFEEILEEDASLSNAFSGFTYFKNALAPGQFTFPSVPVMLTGLFYDNTKPVPEYLEDSFLTHSLFKSLTDAGVRTDVFPFTTDTVFLSPQIASNAILTSPRMVEFLKLLDVGVFRIVPFVFKPYVYRSGNWLTFAVARRTEYELRKATGVIDSTPEALPSADMKSFQDGLETATARTTDTVFKFNHLTGMHVPLLYDEDLNVTRPSYSREHYRSQAIGVLGVMRSLLAKLHELDVYDRSMIIIAGDHGSGRSQDMWIGPADPLQADFNVLKARGSPLLLVKPLAPMEGTSPERLLVSSAPVTLLDIPLTILTGDVRDDRSWSRRRTFVSPE